MTAAQGIRLAIGGSLAGGALALLGEAAAIQTAAGLLLAAGWAGAVAFLLAGPRRRRFWTVWLLAAHLLLLLLGPRDAGRYNALAMAAVFLLLRRQGGWAALSGRQRARAFYLGLLSLAILVPGLRIPAAEGWVPGALRSLGLFALQALRLFWAVTLMKLLLGMRLHFLRLKPKLAVSALFIAIVPLLLVLALVLVGAYGILGANCAARGVAVLRDWSELARAGADLTPVFGEPLRLRAGGAPDPDAPPWQGALLSRLGAAPAGAQEAAWQPADTAAYFRIGREIWLLRVRGVPDGPTAEAYLLGDEALKRLSRILAADAGLFSSENLIIGEEDEAARDRRRDPLRLSIDVRAERETPAEEPGKRRPLLERQLGYGASLLPVIRLSPQGLSRDQVLFHLRVRPSELAREHAAGENEIGRALLVVLAVVAAILLLMVVLAIFLGMRITGGITAAVGALHAGTRRLAAGDLDTRIEVPNQDELGDLAASFNEMAAAVRHGQEEAVARERLEREMETARAIQQRLLPGSAPAAAGWQITGVSLPSRQVGGDYYDFLPLPDGRLGLAIGDVSGKGIGAALLMANLQAALRGQVGREAGAAATVSRVNEMLVRSTDPHLFATFFYAVLDPRAGELVACNAGHCPPLLVRAGGEVVRLEAGGLLLGMLPDRPYEEERVALGPGDLLVLYTDGITEASLASGPAGEEGAGEGMFGEAGLLETLREARGRPAEAVREAILAAVRAHAGEPADDLTLVVVRREADS